MYSFLLIIHALIAASLVGVILLQRSEGGGFAGGGNPSGLMTARGAADFLTRTTAVLAFFFVSFSIMMAVIAAVNRTPATIDTSLAKPVGALNNTPMAETTPAPAAPAAEPIAPLAGGSATVNSADQSLGVAQKNNIAAPSLQKPAREAEENRPSQNQISVERNTPEPKRKVKQARETEAEIVPPVIKPTVKTPVPAADPPTSTPPADNGVAQ
jgi:preprotein translocase subunit SecG